MDLFEVRNQLKNCYLVKGILENTLLMHGNIQADMRQTRDNTASGLYGISAQVLDRRLAGCTGTMESCCWDVKFHIEQIDSIIAELEDMEHQLTEEQGTRREWSYGF